MAQVYHSPGRVTVCKHPLTQAPWPWHTTGIPNEKPSMTPTAVNALAAAVTRQCIDKVHSDERYVELMMELLPEFVTELTGLNDVDNIVEVSMAVMDNLLLVQV